MISKRNSHGKYDGIILQLKPEKFREKRDARTNVWAVMLSVLKG